MTGAMTLTCADPAQPAATVTLHPEWALTEQTLLDAEQQRSLAGRLTSVRWCAVPEYRVPLKRVAAGDAALLQGWWRDGVPLAFTLDTSAQRATVVCRIAGARQPLAQREAPEADAWAGVLTLTARRAGALVGRPFILDDPVAGRLDAPAFTLVD